jgi:putative redox protein
MSDRPFQAKATAYHLRGLQIQVNFSHHSLISDHEPALGGDGMGPAPGIILLGALASSTAYFVSRYAAQLGIPAESVTVKVDSELGREEVEGPVPARIFTRKIWQRIEVSGDLSDAQLATLQEIAELCMVGNTLRQGVEIEKRVVHVPSAD